MQLARPRKAKDRGSWYTELTLKVLAAFSYRGVAVALQEALQSIGMVPLYISLYNKALHMR